jgi:putative ABC transport system permease protein
MMQTIRQAFTILKQNPLLSTISILGTAFAITMIMAIVITWQTKYADLEPEVNRSRCLYFSAMHVQGKENKDWNNFGKPSAAFMKECIQPLPEVEACTAFSTADVALVSLTDGNNRLKVDAMSTDPDFWKIFKLQFLDGKSFTEAERGGDMQSVVISASVARKLFGTTEAAGRQMLLNREVVRIIGVVKDISVTAKDAYAQVWSMYHSNELNVTDWWSYNGNRTIAVLARTPDDFPAIKQGVEKRVKDVNAGLEQRQIDIMEQPDNIVAHVNHVWSNIGPNLPMLYLQYGIALFIILLVPSLNLCGLSNSRMQQRVSELGVRKAFGATDGTLVRQILNENLVLTLIGGVVGLIFSYLAVYAMRTWLFTNSDNIGTAGDFSLSMGALFSPAVFVLAFVFCLLINLLSAGLPAWLATRRTIVDSLNDK